MSDQQSQRSGEEVPEEEPKEILKQEQIAEGLSMIQRTHGKSTLPFTDPLFTLQTAARTRSRN